MPEHIIVFHLPEEEEELKEAEEAVRWKAAVEYIDNELRKKIKYSTNLSSSADERSILQMIRDRLHEILEESDLKLF